MDIHRVLVLETREHENKEQDGKSEKMSIYNRKEGIK